MTEPQHGERRRARRVSVVARVIGHILSLNLPTTLLDLSAGGFLMQSPVQIPVGAVEEFRFTADETEVVVCARVVRSTTSFRSDDLVYVTGLAFINLTEQQRGAIGQLLNPVDPRV